MNLSARHFKAFLVIAATHSFTRAAQQLHISQPGLSLMMREMESQLSCRLFERTTRSVELTAAGMRLLAPARRIMEEIDGLAPVLSQLSVERRRTLHVAATPIFSASIMPHVYIKLRERHPTIDLRLVDVHKHEVERQVRSGDVDCGLGIYAKRLPELTRRPLFEFDFVYIEAKHAPFLFDARKRTAKIAWRDLPDVPFVELNAASELQQLIAKCKTRVGLTRSIEAIRFHNLESLVGMAAAGVGPTILPSFAAPVARQSDVVSALLTDPVLSMDFHMITKRGRAQPAVLEAFTSTLLEVIAERGERTY